MDLHEDTSDPPSIPNLEKDNEHCSVLTGSDIKPKLNPGVASILDSQSKAPSGKYQALTVFPFDKVMTSGDNKKDNQ